MWGHLLRWALREEQIGGGGVMFEYALRPEGPPGEMP